jgi:zinc D-Ala-D-Ala dipeptidase
MKFESAAKYKFVIEPRYYYFGWSKSPQIIGQPRLLKALARARTFLPKGYNFKIWDLQRPRFVQIAMLKSFERRLRAAHPNLPPEQIKKMAMKFGAKPLLRVTRPDTHRNGGAIDLTITDLWGQELYMGTDHDDLTERAATDYFSKLKKPGPIDRIAATNRKLLVDVLTRVGFENLAHEWWHWSYL